MLSRREFGGGLAAGAAMHRRGAERLAPPLAPANEPNLARILRTKKLRVAALAGEEPYFHRDPKSGQWTGFCVAMAQDLAAGLGVEIALSEANWADAATDLHAGKIDLAYSPSPTVQQAMFADFGAPLFHDAYTILARKGFAPKSWAELNVPESLVAVDEGSAREETARRFAGNAAITGFKTRDEALVAVQSGRADCFVATALCALALLNKNPEIGELIVPTPILRAAICPAVPYDGDRRFRGVVDAWSEDNREVGRIRNWVMAGLTASGIAPGDLPPDVSF
ncbi:MAG: transporter substrate-binding domain-containing protein [Alphaproteobacteria bacterium]|nr:transporter substrate-binding domain-containing protein [Alphaproteobacteria bacterium]